MYENLIDNVPMLKTLDVSPSTKPPNLPIINLDCKLTSKEKYSTGLYLNSLEPRGL